MARKFKTPITIDELGSASSQALAANVDGDSQNRVNIDAGGKITWGSGSATGDTTLYRSAADTLKTDDAFTAASLAVTGQFTLPTSDGSANQVLQTDGSGTVSWAAVSGSGSPGGSDGQVQYNNGGAFGGASSLYYDDVNGRVGVGTTSPGAKLDIQNTSGDQWTTNGWGDAVRLENASILRWGIGSTTVHGIGQSGNNLYFGRSTTEDSSSAATTYNMVIDDSGNVGIGTTSPDTNLHIQTASNTLAHFESTDSEALIAFSDNSSTGNWYDRRIGVVGEDMVFITNNTRRITILDNGNVGIGTTTPGYALDVAGDVNFDGSQLHLRGTGNYPNALNFHTSGAEGYFWHMSAPREAESHAWKLYWYNGSSYAQALEITTGGNLNPAGNITVGNGSAAAPSLSFSGDSNTGFYITGNDGVIRWSGNNNTGGYLFNGGIRTDDGSAATPAYSFTSDSNCGMYRYGADDIGFSTGGVARMLIDNGGTAGRIFGPGMATGTAIIRGEATAAVPTYTFYSDENTGMYRYGADSIGFSTGGGYRARIESNGIHLASGDWFRSYGSTGLYNGSHGGGIFMQDSTWVRIYNNKAFLSGTGEVRVQGQITVPNMDATTSYNTVRWNSSNGHLMRYSSTIDIKEDVVSIAPVMEYLNERSLIHDLRPVLFHEKDQADGTNNTRGEYLPGLIAEEVLEVAPELCYYDKDGELLSYGVEALIPHLIAELQRLSPMVESLYGDANPDWVAPTPRPASRANDERAIYDAGVAAIQARTTEEREAEVLTRTANPVVMTSDVDAEAEE